MSRNANGEGSIYQWKRNGKPDGYKGALSYKDETAIRNGMLPMAVRGNRFETNSTPHESG
jgi:hypothetical protein